MKLSQKISQKNKNRIRFLLYAWRYPRDILYCLWILRRWHPTWQLYGTPLIQRHRTAIITIGHHWKACSDPRHNGWGVFQKVTLNADYPKARINIGNNVGMSGATITCCSEISIGDDVLIGSGVLITDNDAHPIHPELRDRAEYVLISPVKLGKRVFVGARAIILKGVTIGDGAVIGAGAVVTKDIPANSIAVGNPARVVGDARDPKYSRCSKSLDVSSKSNVL